MRPRNRPALIIDLPFPNRIARAGRSVKPPPNRLLVDPYPGRRSLHRHRLVVAPRRLSLSITGDPLIHASPLKIIDPLRRQ